MLRAAMPYRGVWKFLRATGRKRKRVEVEEGSDGEVQGGGFEGEGQGGGNGGGGRGNGGGGRGGGIGGGGRGGGIGGGGRGGGGRGGGIGGGGRGGGNGGGGQGGGNPVNLVDVPELIIFGRRSHLDGIAWTCGTCQHENFPSEELLVNLPAFNCSNCNARTRVDFHFSFGNLAANGKCPIGEVLNQGPTNDCLPFALTKGVEMTAKMRETLSGSDLFIPTLDPYSLKQTFIRSRLDRGMPYKEARAYDDAAILEMLEIARTIGVQDESRQHTCRIGGAVQVGGFFEDMVKELANGYPLMVDIMPGREFSNLNYHEIYRCPFNNRTVTEGSRVRTHTVLLVGAARLGDIDYFYFLNSYGELWCVRYHRLNEEDTIGGIGKLIADDICYEPFKFLRMTPP